LPVERHIVIRTLMAQRDRLFAYIWSIVGDAHLAEDVIQDVSVVAAESGEQVADAAALPAWLRSVARNKAYEAIRADRRKPAALDDRVLDQLEAHWADRDDDEFDTLDALHHCLKQLTTHNRRIVTMRYVDGMKSGEIAATLHRPASTIYRALTRIHAALADCIRARRADAEANRDD